MDAEATRLCPKCEVEKSTLEFYFFKSGPSTYCKPCCRRNAIDARLRANAKMSPEQAEAKRVYMAEYSAKYRADPKNADKLQAKYLRHRGRHPEKNRAKQREHRARNRDLALFRSAQSRAKTREWDFTITRQWLRAKLEANVCEATGLAFANGEYVGAGHADPFSASLDRRDSTKGYTPENCRLILWGLNMALSQWGDQVYAEIATAYLSKKASKING